jgi:hypothetical protein
MKFGAGTVLGTVTFNLTPCKYCRLQVIDTVTSSEQYAHLSKWFR